MNVKRDRNWVKWAAMGAAMIFAGEICAAGPARAQAGVTAQSPITPSRMPTGRLTGEVTDSRGTPLAGSSVEVTDLSGKALMTVTTDAKGLYTVDGLVEGEYLLNFDAKGFYKKKQKAKVKAGKTEKVHTKMKFIPIY
jgi:5-hydroxyisourate hydrolase-like protein (transthyretin family)